MEPTKLLAHAQRLQALAQTGLEYAANGYDLERFEEIRDISVKLLQELSDEPYEKIVRVFASEKGYQTPKVDIRAVVFRQESGVHQVLLVREKLDGSKWTLPGGWADIGYTPFEVAVKETEEEAGLLVTPVRLLALWDKRLHAHPPQPWYVYKAFIQCEPHGGALLQDTAETGGAAWFAQNELPLDDLSIDRVTAPQLATLFRFAADPNLPTLCD